jgi:hypothetical protein
VPSLSGAQGFDIALTAVHNVAAPLSMLLCMVMETTQLHFGEGAINALLYGKVAAYGPLSSMQKLRVVTASSIAPRSHPHICRGPPAAARRRPPSPTVARRRPPTTCVCVRVLVLVRCSWCCWQLFASWTFGMIFVGVQAYLNFFENS